MDVPRLSRQLGACWKWIVMILTCAALVIGSAFLVQHQTGVAIGDLTRDPTSVAQVSLYVGYISQLGIFLWAAAATACVLAAIVLRRRVQDVRWRHFFLFAAGLSLMLGFDDVFLLHEVFFPHFGVPELLVLAGYAVLVGTFLWRYFSLLAQTQYLLLLMAFGFLGASVLADMADLEPIEPYLLEDGLKLVGVLSWLSYFMRTALASLAPVASRPEAVRQTGGRMRLVTGRQLSQSSPEAPPGELAPRARERR